jgi:outer membrane cobalamin receptor
MSPFSIFKSSCCTLLTICSLFINSATAQEAPTDSVKYNLPEIVVTSTPLSVPSPNIIRVANTLDFEALNARTVAEAVSQATGFTVQTGTSGDAHITVRGFRHRDILVLFDGIPIASVFEGTIDLNEVTIENVTRVKMIKGAPSVIYGTNAMGGVVDIIPRSGIGIRTGRVLLEIGEHNSHLLKATFGSSAKYFNYFISTKYEASDGFSLSGDYQPERNENGGIRENSDFTRKNYFVHLNSEIKHLGSSSVFLNYADNERGFPPQTGESEPDFERLTKSKRLTFGLSNAFSAFPASVKLYYNNYKSGETAYQDSTYTSVDEVDEGNDYAYGAILYSKFTTLKNQLMTLNLSFEKDRYKNSSDIDNILDVETRNYSLSAEYELFIMKRVSINLGGLYSRLEQPQVNKDLEAFNRQIVLGYRIDDQLTLHSSAAQKTRFPKLRELYRKKYGNPDLQEQTANNYEVGLKYGKPNDRQTDVTLFLHELTDLIDRKDRKSPYENLENVSFKGFECSSQAWLKQHVYGKLGYTYLLAEEELPDGSTRQLRRLPKHNINFEFRYTFPFGLRVSFDGNYVAGLYDLNPDAVYTKIPNYLLLNTKTLMTVVAHLDLFVAIRNITDEYYFQRFGYPREGRAVRLGLESEF